MTSAVYCTQSGNLAGSGCTSTATGWYERSNMPSECTQHQNTNTNHRPVLKRRKKALPAIRAVQQAAHHPALPVPLPAQVPVRHRLHLPRQLK